jgi:putative hydrolase of HD superfamily
MEHQPVIGFLKEIEKFKTCERTCHTTAGRRESDAEHSWHLAFFLMLLESEWKNIDILKLLKMALLHDLPELYAGDTNPYRDDTSHKSENERKASEKLFALLPEDLASRLTHLFDEYTRQETMEARIVKAADKLMPLIQNLCTNQTYSSYRELGVTYEEVIKYMRPFFSDTILNVFYRMLISTAYLEGVFAAPHQEQGALPRDSSGVR